MTNNTMTVKMWDEITEIQSETLNGGSGGGGDDFNFYGPVGPVQIVKGDGVQINPGSISQTFGKNRFFGRRHH